MTTCYISHFDMQRATSGIETASLIGNSMRLSSAVLAGATALPVTPITTVALSVNDRITIFDGNTSETVLVAATAAIGVSSITIQAPGFAYVHAQYTPACSDGLFGSLGDKITDASDWLENICQQTLFFGSQTQTLKMPSMRCAIDNQQQLAIRPHNFPVVGLSGLTIASNNAVITQYDQTQAIIDPSGQSIYVPWLLSGGGVGASTYSITTFVPRRSNLWVTITYTHGYTLATMPGSIRDSAILLTSDILARRENPTGADQATMGKRQMTIGTRNDKSGQTALLKAAMRQLQSYTSEAY